MRRRAGWRDLVAVLAAITSIAACRQLVGITDSPATDLTSTLCGLPYGTNTCASCANTSCCAESTTCAADPVCSAYEGCLGKCNGDPKCRALCTIDNPVGAASDVSALSACLASNCETACGLGCGGFASYLSEPDASTACASCIQKNACTQATACGSSAECDAFWRCYLACQTPDCQWACAGDHDAGVALFRPLYQDFSSTCAGPCGYGSDWACAGHITWPNAKSRTVTWTWWVYDFQTGAGIPGAEVSICGSSTGPGCPCPTSTNRVLAQAPTDWNGYATLTFQQELTPTGGGSSYCAQTTAPGYLANLAAQEYPNTGPVVSITNSLLATTAWGIALQTPGAQASDSVANGAASDPTVAPVVAAGIYDCLGSPANGVDVSITGPPAVADAVDGGPLNRAIAVFGVDAGPGGSTTAQSIGGRVFFLDVPAGNVMLTATVPGVGVVSQVSMTAAANTITQVAMPPTPSP
jgi:hypothetical protein